MFYVLDKYRHAARYQAWYDDDESEGSANYNPFKKNRKRRRTADIEASSGNEEALRQIRSAGDQPNSEGLEAHRETSRSPPTSANGHTGEKSAENGVLGSQHHLNGSAATNEEKSVPTEDQGPIQSDDKLRKRRGFISKLLHKNNEEDEGTEMTRRDSKQPMRRRATGEEKEKPKFTVGGQLKASIFNSWINILLLAVPVGIALNFTSVSKVAVFVVNFIAIIPLAALLSYATEEIALRTGEVLGGLLNASFGNAVELIVSIIALFQNQILVVQTSLIGSMLSNLLLVMGMCFFFGGVNRLEQNFNVTVAQTASSLLALAIGSLIIPTAFVQWGDAGDAGIVPLSRGVAVLLLFVYACYLLFQLKSHTEMYNKPSPKVEKRKKSVEPGVVQRGLAKMGAGAGAQGGEAARLNSPNKDGEDKEDVDEPEEPQLHFWVAIGLLLVSTVFVAICAEFMVDAIDAVTEAGGISKTFVGLILLPIVGNAAEHATAVTVAVKDKMDLAIGVAVGSSMQIALLVIPFVIVVGWIAGKDDMVSSNPKFVLFTYN